MENFHLEEVTKFDNSFVKFVNFRGEKVVLVFVNMTGYQQIYCCYVKSDRIFGIYCHDLPCNQFSKHLHNFLMSYSSCSICATRPKVAQVA